MYYGKEFLKLLFMTSEISHYKNKIHCKQFEKIREYPIY